MQRAFTGINSAAGQLQIGFWQSLATAITAEISAYAGFDWLLIDGEHGANDLRSIRDQLQVVGPSPSQAVVRISGVDVVEVKQVMDAGAQSILVPIVNTAEDAALMAAAMRYPPDGTRGNGAGVARAADAAGQWPDGDPSVGERFGGGTADPESLRASMPALDNPIVTQLLADRASLERAHSRIDTLSKQLGESLVANDDLRTSFGRLADQRDAVVRQNAALKLELARAHVRRNGTSADGSGVPAVTAAAKSAADDETDVGENHENKESDDPKDKKGADDKDEKDPPRRRSDRLRKKKE